MTKSLSHALTVLFALSSAPVLAQGNHSHEHTGGVDFATLDDGWVVLENVTANIRTAVSSDNLAALHDLTTELHTVADRFGKLAGDVPQANQLRFTSSVNQLRTLSDRLHVAHEEGNAEAARQMVPQLDGVVQLLMVSAEAE